MAETVDRGERLLTNSRLSVFRDCAMKHALMYEDGWRPGTDAEPLRMGSLIHVGLEAWWKRVARQDADIVDAEEARTRELPADQLSFAFNEAIEAVRATPKSEDEVLLVKVEEMLRGYHMAWRYDAMLYRVLAVELAFVAPLLNPETRGQSRTYDLAGKIDVVVQRRDDETVGNIEHKSTTERIGDGDPYWLKLAMDCQISLYTIGAESHGMQPSWTLYDVLKKPELELLQATPEEKRKFRAPKGAEEKTWAVDDPRLLYANLRERDETLEEYRARTRTLLEELDGAGRPRFFQRRVIQRLQGQMQDFLVDTWSTARTIREMQLAGRRPRNPNACHRFSVCAFWNHCANGEELKTLEEGGRFRKLTYLHPELEGAF